MLCRAIARPLHLLSLRNLTLASSSSRLLPSSSPLLPPPPPPPPQPPAFPTPSPHSRWFLLQSLKPFSTTSRGDNGDGTWKFSPDSADDLGSVFGAEEGSLAGITEGGGGEDPVVADTGSGLKEGAEKDIFEGIQGEFAAAKEDVWETAEGYRPWSLGDDGEKGDLFDVGEGADGIEGIGDSLEEERSNELKILEAREKELLATLKGPNRAFGDLIAASGITEDMIESLILLKDVRGIPGLPPLSEIEDKAIARMNATSSRAEIERKKQEEIAKSRVRQVDEKGRAYGTGRRKCSVARVWIQPGEGKFIVNDKEFDAYFPILDHRADLLRPFTETKTLGVWDVKCTVKGGGVSGQVGAIRLGISKALQNWEPGFRPYLKSAGYLTRDSRVVERKKPGKAKARKSFQWVKR